MDVEIALGNFYHPRDEDRLFRGFEENRAIKKVEGVGRNLILSIEMKKLNREELSDLFSLLFRYQIPLAPFYFLAEKKRFSWINNPAAYWFDSLFDKTKRTRPRFCIDK
ncbi:hypothetical protein [Herbaspirillum sp. VT-16-41]|uniref:hypothetical protein n=1 Tax=Herbaspirillum sp. VT-16-41 TaxID=1953765 RepID=UPI0020C29F94|nr:hypothetical protein [Herbaspirillum sp. VT-16-41]